MTLHRFGVDRTPGLPEGLLSQLWERSRLEWRIGDDGDPAVLVEEFLADQGLPVRDLAAPPGGGRAHQRAGQAYGATLFVSAAAGAHLAGAPTGAPSPVPAVPDVVAVAWDHTGVPRLRRPASPAGPAGPAGMAAAGGPAGPAGMAATGGPAGPAGMAATGGPAGPARRPGWGLGPWQPGWSPAEHAAAVAAVRHAIARGDVYQVNVVGHAAAGYQGDPAPALRRLTQLPGARYAGVLRGVGPGGSWAVACASPETLVEVVGGRAVTRPIKGTRPATAAGRAELLASPKERAEHIMIVDLERNDLARLARTGSVRVEQLYAVRRWCDLWQAESEISARLASGVGLAGLLRAVCPGGSVTGAPKRAALELIAAVEPVGRGASMGALGWVGHGHVDLGLTIRTVALDADRIHLWAGGGITWGSDPAAEVSEAAAKAGPLKAALRPAAGQEALVNTTVRRASARSSPSAE